MVGHSCAEARCLLLKLRPHPGWMDAADINELSVGCCFDPVRCCRKLKILYKLQPPPAVWLLLGLMFHTAATTVHSAVTIVL